MGLLRGKSQRSGELKAISGLPKPTEGLVHHGKRQFGCKAALLDFMIELLLKILDCLIPLLKLIYAFEEEGLEITV